MNTQGKQPVHDDIKKRLEECEKQSTLWKDKYLRALADYQNVVKRSEEEGKNIRKFAAREVIEKLLPVIDIFEKAQAHLSDEGLELALKELTACLSTFGVRKIDADNKQFDPYTMDCVDVVDGKENVVKSIVSPGYEMHGKVIRPTRVLVGKKIEEQKKKFDEVVKKV